jgi:hypothetical protein
MVKTVVLESRSDNVDYGLVGTHPEDGRDVFLRNLVTRHKVLQHKTINHIFTAVKTSNLH